MSQVDFKNKWEARKIYLKVKVGRDKLIVMILCSVVALYQYQVDRLVAKKN